MSRVSYFQRFSQPENHATNNTLLLLRHFYQSSPFKIERILTSLLETEFSIGLTFEQQIKGDQSIPDALISQQPLSIYIETKRGDMLDEEQIQRHIRSIAAKSTEHGQVILLGLTKEAIPSHQAQTLHDEAIEQGIHFAAVTFSQIVEAVYAECADYERDLIAVVEDYEQFLAEERLLQTSNQRLVIFPCGQSFAENRDYGLYYEPANRSSKQGNKFIGIYHQKQVKLVGSIEAIAVCTYNPVNIHAQVESGTFTPEHSQRVKKVIESTPYYDLKKEPLRFYLVSEFAPTNLYKATPGGMRGHRYLDIVAVTQESFDPRKNYTNTDLAELLKGKTFD